MDLSIYFKPSQRFGRSRPEWSAQTLGDGVTMFTQGKEFPELTGMQIAIFGVLDDPGHSRPRSCISAPDFIRDELYKLHQPATAIQLVDLGDIHPGASAADTQHAVAETLAELIRLKRADAQRRLEAAPASAAPAKKN